MDEPNFIILGPSGCVVYQADLPVCCFDALSHLLLFDEPEKLASIIENFLWHGIYKLRGGKGGIS
jgi:hypothetical protein